MAQALSPGPCPSVIGFTLLRTQPVPGSRLPTYFISHGGGPWPYMTGEFRTNLAQLEQSLVDMRAELDGAPQAVLMVSGHW